MTNITIRGPVPKAGMLLPSMPNPPVAIPVMR